jgi:glutamate racemase
MAYMSPDAPIAVLDSGLAGLTLVRALRAGLPHEQIIYLGDTARAHYGGKSAELVTTFVREAVSYLMVHQPKHIVIGCNTASALALPAIRASFPGMSISGVVEPAARAAIDAAGAKAVPLIGILATEATIWSKAYEKAIHRRRHHARLLLRPAPLLVPLVEEGRELTDAVLKLALQQYLHPIASRGADVLILGCTHLSLLKPLITRFVGRNTILIDSAERCAEDVARRLQATGLLRSARDSHDLDDLSTGGDELRCFVTDEPPRYRTLARRFLGDDPGAPTRVTLDELQAACRDARPPLRASA